jgi:2-oxoglutarate ferredoxin oxidoreductase subunit beta
VGVFNPLLVIKAKKAIKKAFQDQLNGKHFTFVEVLSTCPTNWGMTPEESTAWLEKNMLPYYPLGCFKDTYYEEPEVEQPRKEAAK